MVLIHELGHYTAGKILKFKIDEFSVGFGPKLLQKTRDNGEKISLRAIPLGGYCAFYGEEDVPEKSTVTAETAIPFNHHAPWKRIIVFAAGAGFNFFSAFIFSFIYIFAVGYGLPVVNNVFYDGVRPYCELKSGDIITEVDGNRVGVLSSYAELMSDKTEGDTVTFTVIRNDNEMQITAVMQKIKADGLDEYVGVGISPKYEIINYNFGDAATMSAPFTFKMSWAILGSLGKLVTGQVAPTELTGPIGTVTAIAEYSMIDWRYILLFLPLIASNLAIFNLLPIPALDGLKIIFAGIEAVRKKPINKKAEYIINVVGMFALFAFVIIIDLVGFILRL